MNIKKTCVSCDKKFVYKGNAEVIDERLTIKYCENCSRDYLENRYPFVCKLYFCRDRCKRPQFIAAIAELIEKSYNERRAIEKRYLTAVASMSLKYEEEFYQSRDVVIGLIQDLRRSELRELGTVLKGDLFYKIHDDSLNTISIYNYLYRMVIDILEEVEVLGCNLYNTDEDEYMPTLEDVLEAINVETYRYLKCADVDELNSHARVFRDCVLKRITLNRDIFYKKYETSKSIKTKHANLMKKTPIVEKLKKLVRRAKNLKETGSIVRDYRDRSYSEEESEEDRRYDSSSEDEIVVKKVPYKK